MQYFRTSALLKLVIALSLILVPIVSAESQGFDDVPQESLYAPHIQSLLGHHLITGYTDEQGRFSSQFGPNDSISRAAFTKLMVHLHLAEEADENLAQQSLTAISFLFDNLLTPFYNCSEQPGTCNSIGGSEFIDVPPKSPTCGLDTSILCHPWFSQYVYYAVNKGFIKGFNIDGQTAFRPEAPITRLHALKMLLTDDGNLSPIKDKRFNRLSQQANDRNSYYPKCLAGAENHILAHNGGNTDDAQKLLQYALLADRLDFFGNACQVMGGHLPPDLAAHYLQKPLLRKEAARFMAIATAYRPINPDPTLDDTINSIDENPYPAVGSPYYVIPRYRKVSLESGPQSYVENPDDAQWCFRTSPECMFVWGLQAYSQGQIILYEKMSLGLIQASMTSSEDENLSAFKRQKARYQESITTFPTNLLDWLLETEEDKEISRYLSNYQKILTIEEAYQLTDEELMEHLKALKDHQFEMIQIDLTGGIKNVGSTTGGKASGVGSAIGRFKSGAYAKIKSLNIRVFNVTKAESKMWKSFKPYRGNVKTNGLSGKSKRFYQWDYTHNDIEVYGADKAHMGSMNPMTGEIYKPAIKKRSLNL